jgi:hypothetical protein
MLAIEKLSTSSTGQVGRFGILPTCPELEKLPSNKPSLYDWSCYFEHGRYIVQIPGLGATREISRRCTLLPQSSQQHRNGQSCCDGIFEIEVVDNAGGSDES